MELSVRSRDGRDRVSVWSIDSRGGRGRIESYIGGEIEGPECAIIAGGGGGGGAIGRGPVGDA